MFNNLHGPNNELFIQGIALVPLEVIELLQPAT